MEREREREKEREGNPFFTPLFTHLYTVVVFSGWFHRSLSLLGAVSHGLQRLVSPKVSNFCSGNGFCPAEAMVPL